MRIVDKICMGNRDRIRLSGANENRAHMKRAQAMTVTTLVGVALMAIVGFIIMSLLGGGLFSFPSNLMITVDESMLAEDLADITINNKNMLVYTGNGRKEAGVIEVSSFTTPIRALSTDAYGIDQKWRINIADLIEKSDHWEQDSGGITSDWQVVATASRYVTLVRTDEDSSGAVRNPGELNFTLYRKGG